MSFGIYREGRSFAHRLCPQTKLLFVLAYMLAVFLAGSLLDCAVLAAVALLAAAACKLTPLQAWRAVRPFAPLIAFVVIFDLLFCADGELLLEWGPLHVSSGGAELALRSAVGFVCMLLATSSLMAVAAPQALADGVALLFKPLVRCGLKVDDLVLALGLALRFIPVLSEELAAIKQAQLARFAPLDDPHPLRRLKAHVPVMVPLFASALRRSQVLALSLENRGYGTGEPGARSSLRSYPLSWRDALALAAAAATLATALLM